MIRLTKAKAVQEHRKMWNWIADYLESQTEMEGHICKADNIKEMYFKEHNLEPVKANCFCCHYNGQFRKHTKYDFCEYCPLDVENPNGTSYGCLDGAYGRFMFAVGKEKVNLKYAAEIARKIANLPERENLVLDILENEVTK